MTDFLRGLDRLIGRVVAVAKWLALPLIVLLFLQWPLRDLFRGYSREANDLGQVAFALFVAVSVTAATRAGTHLAADLLAQRYSARTRRRLKQMGAAAGLLPWALFVLIASKTTVLSGLRDLESFQVPQNSPANVTLPASNSGQNARPRYLRGDLLNEFYMRFGGLAIRQSGREA